MRSDSAGYFRVALLTVAVCGLLLAGLLRLLPPGALWITDNGNKYILMRNVMAHGTASVVNPAAEIDPENRFFADGGFHFQRVGGVFRSVYPEFFSVLTIPFFAMFGERGVAVLPILGTLAVLSCFLALLRTMRLPAAVCAALGFLLVFATPFAFYSLVFWEMTVGCALLCGAVLAVIRRKFIVAGILIGIGVWLREELYFAAAALAAAVFLTAEEHRFRAVFHLALGALPGVAGLWILQWMQSGHILGLHGSLYYSHNTGGNAPSLVQQVFGGVKDAYGFYWFGHIAPQKWLLAAPVLLVVAGALPRCHSAFSTKSWLLIASGISLFGLAAALAQAPAGAVGMAVGLVPALPVAAGFWLNWRPLCRRGGGRTRLLAYFVLFYTILLPPFLTRSDIGVIWSARHFLFVAPFLLYLSTAGLLRMGVTRSRLLQTGALLAVGAALVLEVHGLRILSAVSRESAAVTEAIRATPGDVVVSDVFFLPEQTPELFLERRWLFVKSGDRIPELIELLKSRNIRNFTLVLSPNWREIDDVHLEMLLKAAPPVREIQRLPGTESGFLELLIAECRLQSGVNPAILK